MDPALSSTLMKLSLPVAVIIFVLIVTRLRGVSWKEDLGLIWPKPTTGLGWLGFWIVWMAVGEAAIWLFGMEQAVPWKEYSLLVVILRIAAIGILGPASEEIVMRGVLFDRIRRTTAGPIGAIVIVAALWAATHYRYEWMTIGLIFADGLVLGAARHHSRSTLLPIVMHSLGNLISIYQSLHQ